MYCKSTQYSTGIPNRSVLIVAKCIVNEDAGGVTSG